MKKKLLSVGLVITIIITLTGCSSAGSYDKAGKKYFSDGNYEAAATSFSDAISANPNRADYYIDYGMALIELGKEEEAITQFDHVYMDKDIILINKNNKRALRGKGIAYYSSQKYEEAITQFEAAAQINQLKELDEDILTYMADTYIKLGNNDKAIETYTLIISENQKNASALIRRAVCYKNTGDYEKSLADYDAVIALEPANYDYYFGKYYLMSENDDESGAAAVLLQLAAIAAKTEEDKYNVAKLHFLQGDYETALTEFDKAYSNGIVEANFYVGEIYRENKDYTKAVYYYELFIKDSDAVSPAVYNQMAYCLIKMEKYTEALEYLEKGIKQNQAGFLQILMKNEIIAYEKLGKLKEANKKLGEYLALYSGDGQTIREAEFLETRLIKPVIEEAVK